MGTRKLIVVGDITTGGGTVATGSAGTDIDGVPVARVNDKCTCPKHKGVFPIVTGDVTFIVDGQPVAREGDYLACGCRLISVRQFRVFLDDCTSDDPGADKAMFERMNVEARPKTEYDEQLRFISDSGLPLSLTRYRITLGDGSIAEGRTDENGQTRRITSAQAQPIVRAEFFPEAKMQLCCARHVEPEPIKPKAVPIQDQATNPIDLGASQQTVTLEGSARPLTTGEIMMAQHIFKGAIDYNRVKVHDAEYLLFGLQPDNTAMTPDGEMYFNPKRFLEDFSSGTDSEKHWFMHEMTHVWQYQLGYPVFEKGALLHPKSGWGHIYDPYSYALARQDTVPPGSSEYPGWKSVKIKRIIRPDDPKSAGWNEEAIFNDRAARLSDYNMEQQGDIIADFNSIYTGLGVLSESGRAVKDRRDFYEVLRQFRVNPEDASLLPDNTF